MSITPLSSDLLLVIDVQYDFCPGGGLGVADGDAVVPEINRIAREFAHVVLTQDWHPAGHSSFASSHDGAAPFSQVTMPYGPQTLWPDHCVQGTRGAELHDGLELPQAEMVIRKGYRRPAWQAICVSAAFSGSFASGWRPTTACASRRWTRGVRVSRRR